MYLLSEPSVSSRYFNKIKRTSYLGKLPALSLEILCRLHGGIKTAKLHNLINHNTNLNDLWLRTLEHNSFQTC